MLQLFLLSESVHSTTTPSLTKDGKRPKLENPITSLLNSIQSQTNPIVRSYHLQILLFFIDKHWLILHDSLQQDVLSTLLQFVSFDDGVIQSWIFMCFAAIAYIDGTAPPPPPRAPRASSQTILSQERPRDPITWDPIWTHAVRRANVPTVCRAACHAAYTLLVYSERLLTSHRVLLEVETFTKDLDVQGPPLPYDSVCVFLSQALRVASQDVRLYRMQLEEKVLSWLMDSWGVGDGGRIGRSKMPSYMIGDVIGLLECICGFGRRYHLVARPLLPACSIKDHMVEEGMTKVIRDFLLEATLPPFRGSVSTEKGKGVERKPDKFTVSISTTKEKDLVQPRGRERKVSAYILKSLEVLMGDWETAREAHISSTAENARRSIDMAVVALSFEALLVSNGTKPNRRVVQAACKLVTSVTHVLMDSRWTAEEKALIMMGLAPLVETGEGETRENVGWEAMLPPDAGTGIKSQTLHKLRRELETQRGLICTLRREFQKIIWQNADVRAYCTARRFTHTFCPT
jgi:serine-protein kinase ATM